MHQLEITSHAFRKARTRTLVQLGGLVEKSGLVEAFGLIIGADLQKDPDMREPNAALLGAFSVLAQEMRDDVYSWDVLVEKGKRAFGKIKNSVEERRYLRDNLTRSGQQSSLAEGATE